MLYFKEIEMKKTVIMSILVIFSLFVISSAYAGAECPQPRKTKAAPGSIAKKDKTAKATRINALIVFLK